jgi:aspartate aminotransferase-like enzyme
LPNYESDSARSTPPVPALLALQQALIEMPGGVASYRREVYIARANRLRNALLERDLAFVVDPAKASCTLTTCQVPAGFTASQWLAANYEKGYVLYGCKGELAESCFQVANMGELTDEQIEDWVAVFRELTAKMGS